jgi:hypothetical protein
MYIYAHTHKSDAVDDVSLLWERYASRKLKHLTFTLQMSPLFQISVHRL